MPIAGQQSHAKYGYGGDDGLIKTTTINFAPGTIQAQVCLTRTEGGGWQSTGIQGYRHRPDPDGPEKVVDFGSYGNWRTIVGIVERMTSVTWGIALGSDQGATARLDILWWS